MALQIGSRKKRINLRKTQEKFVAKKKRKKNLRVDKIRITMAATRHPLFKRAGYSILHLILTG